VNITQTRFNTKASYKDWEIRKGWHVTGHRFKDVDTGKDWLFLDDLGFVLETHMDFSGGVFIYQPFVKEEKKNQLGYIHRSPWGTLGKLIYSSSKSELLVETRRVLEDYYKVPEHKGLGERSEALDKIMALIGKLVD